MAPQKTSTLVEKFTPRIKRSTEGRTLNRSFRPNNGKEEVKELFKRSEVTSKPSAVDRGGQLRNSKEENRKAGGMKGKDEKPRQSLDYNGRKLAALKLQAQLKSKSGTEDCLKIDSKEREIVMSVMKREIRQEEFRLRVAKLEKGEVRRANRTIVDLCCRQLAADMTRKAIMQQKQSVHDCDDLDSVVESKRKLSKNISKKSSPALEERRSVVDRESKRNELIVSDGKLAEKKNLEKDLTISKEKNERLEGIGKKFAKGWLNFVGTEEGQRSDTYNEAVFRIREKMKALVNKLKTETGEVNFTRVIRGLVQCKTKKDSTEMSKETQETMNYIVDLLIKAAFDTYKKHRNPFKKAEEKQANRGGGGGGPKDEGKGADCLGEDELKRLLKCLQDSSHLGGRAKKREKHKPDLIGKRNLPKLLMPTDGSPSKAASDDIGREKGPSLTEGIGGEDEEESQKSKDKRGKPIGKEKDPRRPPPEEEGKGRSSLNDEEDEDDARLPDDEDGDWEGKDGPPTDRKRPAGVSSPSEAWKGNKELGEAASDEEDGDLRAPPSTAREGNQFRQPPSDEESSTGASSSTDGRGGNGPGKSNMSVGAGSSETSSLHNLKSVPSSVPTEGSGSEGSEHPLKKSLSKGPQYQDEKAKRKGNAKKPTDSEDFDSPEESEGESGSNVATKPGLDGKKDGGGKGRGQDKPGESKRVPGGAGTRSKDKNIPGQYDDDKSRDGTGKVPGTGSKEGRESSPGALKPGERKSVPGGAGARPKKDVPGQADDKSRDGARKVPGTGTKEGRESSPGDIPKSRTSNDGPDKVDGSSKGKSTSDKPSSSTADRGTKGKMGTSRSSPVEGSGPSDEDPARESSVPDDDGSREYPGVRKRPSAAGLNKSEDVVGGKGSEGNADKISQDATVKPSKPIGRWKSSYGDLDKLIGDVIARLAVEGCDTSDEDLRRKILKPGDAGSRELAGGKRKGSAKRPADSEDFDSLEEIGRDSRRNVALKPDLEGRDGGGKGRGQDKPGGRKSVPGGAGRRPNDDFPGEDDLESRDLSSGKGSRDDEPDKVDGQSKRKISDKPSPTAADRGTKGKMGTSRSSPADGSGPRDEDPARRSSVPGDDGSREPSSAGQKPSMAGLNKYQDAEEGKGPEGNADKISRDATVKPSKPIDRWKSSYGDLDKLIVDAVARSTAQDQPLLLQGLGLTGRGRETDKQPPSKKEPFAESEDSPDEESAGERSVPANDGSSKYSGAGKRPSMTSDDVGRGKAAEGKNGRRPSQRNSNKLVGAPGSSAGKGSSPGTEDLGKGSVFPGALSGDGRRKSSIPGSSSAADGAGERSKDKPARGRLSQDGKIIEGIDRREPSQGNDINTLKRSGSGRETDEPSSKNERFANGRPRSSKEMPSGTVPGAIRDSDIPADRSRRRSGAGSATPGTLSGEESRKSSIPGSSSAAIEAGGRSKDQTARGGRPQDWKGIDGRDGSDGRDYGPQNGGKRDKQTSGTLADKGSSTGPEELASGSSIPGDGSRKLGGAGKRRSVEGQNESEDVVGGKAPEGKDGRRGSQGDRNKLIGDVDKGLSNPGSISAADRAGGSTKDKPARGRLTQDGKILEGIDGREPSQGNDINTLKRPGSEREADEPFANGRPRGSKEMPSGTEPGVIRDSEIHADGNRRRSGAGEKPSTTAGRNKSSDVGGGKATEGSSDKTSQDGTGKPPKSTGRSKSSYGHQPLLLEGLGLTGRGRETDEQPSSKEERFAARAGLRDSSLAAGSLAEKGSSTAPEDLARRRISAALSGHESRKSSIPGSSSGAGGRSKEEPGRGSQSKDGKVPEGKDGRGAFQGGVNKLVDAPGSPVGEGSIPGNEDFGKRSLFPGALSGDGRRKSSITGSSSAADEAGERPKDQLATGGQPQDRKGKDGRDGRNSEPQSGGKRDEQTPDEGSSTAPEGLARRRISGALSGDKNRKFSFSGSSSAALGTGGRSMDEPGLRSQSQNGTRMEGKDGRRASPGDMNKLVGDMVKGKSDGSADNGSSTAPEDLAKRRISDALSGDGSRKSSLPGPRSAAERAGGGRGRQSQDEKIMEGRDERNDINTLKRPRSGRESDEPSSKDERFASGRAAEARTGPRDSKEMPSGTEPGAIRDSDIPADGSRRRSGAGEKPSTTAGLNKTSDVGGGKVPEGIANKTSQDGSGKLPKPTERGKSSYGDQPLLLEGLGLTGRGRETDEQPSSKDERFAARTGPRDSSLADKGSSAAPEDIARRRIFGGLYGDGRRKSSTPGSSSATDGAGGMSKDQLVRGSPADKGSSTAPEELARKRISSALSGDGRRKSGIPNPSSVADGARGTPMDEFARGRPPQDGKRIEGRNGDGRESSEGDIDKLMGHRTGGETSDAAIRRPESGRSRGDPHKPSPDSTGKSPGRRRSSNEDVDELVSDHVTRSDAAFLDRLEPSGTDYENDDGAVTPDRDSRTGSHAADRVTDNKVPVQASQLDQPQTKANAKIGERRKSSYGDLDKLISEAVERSRESKQYPTSSQGGIDTDEPSSREERLASGIPSKARTKTEPDTSKDAPSHRAGFGATQDSDIRGEDEPGVRKNVRDNGAGTRAKEDVPGQDVDDKSRDGTRKVPGTVTKEGRKSSGADDIPNGEKRKSSDRPSSSTAGYNGKGEIGRPLSSIVEGSGTSDEDLGSGSIKPGDDGSREYSGAGMRPSIAGRNQSNDVGGRKRPADKDGKFVGSAPGGSADEGSSSGIEDIRKGSVIPGELSGDGSRKSSNPGSNSAADRAGGRPIDKPARGRQSQDGNRIERIDGREPSQGDDINTLKRLGSGRKSDEPSSKDERFASGRPAEARRVPRDSKEMPSGTEPGAIRDSDIPADGSRRRSGAEEKPFTAGRNKSDDVEGGKVREGSADQTSQDGSEKPPKPTERRKSLYGDRDKLVGHAVARSTAQDQPLLLEGLGLTGRGRETDEQPSSKDDRFAARKGPRDSSLADKGSSTAPEDIARRRISGGLSGDGFRKSSIPGSSSATDGPGGMSTDQLVRGSSADKGSSTASEELARKRISSAFSGDGRRKSGIHNPSSAADGARGTPKDEFARGRPPQDGKRIDGRDEDGRESSVRDIGKLMGSPSGAETSGAAIRRPESERSRGDPHKPSPDITGKSPGRRRSLNEDVDELVSDPVTRSDAAILDRLEPSGTDYEIDDGPGTPDRDSRTGSRAADRVTDKKVPVQASQLDQPRTKANAKIGERRKSSYGDLDKLVSEAVERSQESKQYPTSSQDGSETDEPSSRQERLASGIPSKARTGTEPDTSKDAPSHRQGFRATRDSDIRKEDEPGVRNNVRDNGAGTRAKDDVPGQDDDDKSRDGTRKVPGTVTKEGRKSAGADIPNGEKRKSSDRPSSSTAGYKGKGEIGRPFSSIVEGSGTSDEDLGSINLKPGDDGSREYSGAGKRPSIAGRNQSKDVGGGKGSAGKDGRRASLGGVSKFVGSAPGSSADESSSPGTEDFGKRSVIPGALSGNGDRQSSIPGSTTTADRAGGRPNDKPARGRQSQDGNRIEGIDGREPSQVDDINTLKSLGSGRESDEPSSKDEGFASGRPAKARTGPRDSKEMPSGTEPGAIRDSDIPADGSRRRSGAGEKPFTAGRNKSDDVEGGKVREGSADQTSQDSSGKPPKPTERRKSSYGDRDQLDGHAVARSTAQDQPLLLEGLGLTGRGRETDAQPSFKDERFAARTGPRDSSLAEGSSTTPEDLARRRISAALTGDGRRRSGIPNPISAADGARGRPRDELPSGSHPQNGKRMEGRDAGGRKSSGADIDRLMGSPIGAETSGASNRRTESGKSRADPDKTSKEGTGKGKAPELTNRRRSTNGDVDKLVSDPVTRSDAAILQRLEPSGTDYENDDGAATPDRDSRTGSRAADQITDKKVPLQASQLDKPQTNANAKIGEKRKSSYGDLDKLVSEAVERSRESKQYPTSSQEGSEIEEPSSRQERLASGIPSKARTGTEPGTSKDAPSHRRGSGATRDSDIPGEYEPGVRKNASDGAGTGSKGATQYQDEKGKRKGSARKATDSEDFDTPDGQGGGGKGQAKPAGRKSVPDGAGTRSTDKYIPGQYDDKSRDGTGRVPETKERRGSSLGALKPDLDGGGKGQDQQGGRKSVPDGARPKDDILGQDNDKSRDGTRKVLGTGSIEGRKSSGADDIPNGAKRKISAKLSSSTPGYRKGNVEIGKPISSIVEGSGTSDEDLAGPSDGSRKLGGGGGAPNGGGKEQAKPGERKNAPRGAGTRPNDDIPDEDDLESRDLGSGKGSRDEEPDKVDGQSKRKISDKPSPTAADRGTKGKMGTRRSSPGDGSGTSDEGSARRSSVPGDVGSSEYSGAGKRSSIAGQNQSNDVGGGKGPAGKDGRGASQGGVNKLVYAPSSSVDEGSSSGNEDLGKGSVFPGAFSGNGSRKSSNPGSNNSADRAGGSTKDKPARGRQSQDGNRIDGRDGREPQGDTNTLKRLGSGRESDEPSSKDERFASGRPAQARTGPRDSKQVPSRSEPGAIRNSDIPAADGSRRRSGAGEKPSTTAGLNQIFDVEAGKVPEGIANKTSQNGSGKPPKPTERRKSSDGDQPLLLEGLGLTGRERETDAQPSYKDERFAARPGPRDSTEMPFRTETGAIRDRDIPADGNRRPSGAGMRPFMVGQNKSADVGGGKAPEGSSEKTPLTGTGKASKLPTRIRSSNGDVDEIAGDPVTRADAAILQRLESSGSDYENDDGAGTPDRVSRTKADAKQVAEKVPAHASDPDKAQPKTNNRNGERRKSSYGDLDKLITEAVERSRESKQYTTSSLDGSETDEPSSRQERLASGIPSKARTGTEPGTSKDAPSHRRGSGATRDSDILGEYEPGVRKNASDGAGTGPKGGALYQDEKGKRKGSASKPTDSEDLDSPDGNGGGGKGQAKPGGRKSVPDGAGTRSTDKNIPGQYDMSRDGTREVPGTGAKEWRKSSGSDIPKRKISDKPSSYSAGGRGKGGLGRSFSSIVEGSGTEEDEDLVGGSSVRSDDGSRELGGAKEQAKLGGRRNAPRGAGTRPNADIPGEDDLESRYLGRRKGSRDDEPDKVDGQSKQKISDKPSPTAGDRGTKEKMGTRRSSAEDGSGTSDEDLAGGSLKPGDDGSREYPGVGRRRPSIAGRNQSKDVEGGKGPEGKNGRRASQGDANRFVGSAPGSSADEGSSSGTEDLRKRNVFPGTLSGDARRKYGTPGSSSAADEAGGRPKDQLARGRQSQDWKRIEGRGGERRASAEEDIDQLMRPRSGPETSGAANRRRESGKSWGDPDKPSPDGTRSTAQDQPLLLEGLGLSGRRHEIDEPSSKEERSAWGRPSAARNGTEHGPRGSKEVPSRSETGAIRDSDIPADRSRRRSGTGEKSSTAGRNTSADVGGGKAPEGSSDKTSPAGTGKASKLPGRRRSSKGDVDEMVGDPVTRADAAILQRLESSGSDYENDDGAGTPDRVSRTKADAKQVADKVPAHASDPGKAQTTTNTRNGERRKSSYGDLDKLITEAVEGSRESKQYPTSSQDGNETDEPSSRQERLASGISSKASTGTEPGTSKNTPSHRRGSGGTRDSDIDREYEPGVRKNARDGAGTGSKGRTQYQDEKGKGSHSKQIDSDDFYSPEESERESGRKVAPKPDLDGRDGGSGKGQAKPGGRKSVPDGAGTRSTDKYIPEQYDDKSRDGTGKAHQTKEGRGSSLGALEPDLDGKDGEDGKGHDNLRRRRSAPDRAGARPKNDVPGQDDDESRDGTRTVTGTGAKEWRKSSGADIPKRKISDKPSSYSADDRVRGKFGKPLSSIVEGSGTEEDEDLVGGSSVPSDDESRELASAGAAPNGGEKGQDKLGGRNRAPGGAGTRPNDDIQGEDYLESRYLDSGKGSRDLGSGKGSRDEEPDKVDGQSKRKISDKPSPTAADRGTKGKMGTRRSSPGDGSGTSDEGPARRSSVPGDDGSREYSGAGKRPSIAGRNQSNDVGGGKGPAGKDGRRASQGGVNTLVDAPLSSEDGGSSPGSEDLGKGSVFAGAFSGDGSRKSSNPGSSSAADRAGRMPKDQFARERQHQDGKRIEGRDGDGRESSEEDFDKMMGPRSVAETSGAANRRRESGKSRGDPDKLSSDGTRSTAQDQPLLLEGLGLSGRGRDTDEPSSREERLANGIPSKARTGTEPGTSKDTPSHRRGSGATRDSDIPREDESGGRKNASDGAGTGLKGATQYQDGKGKRKGSASKPTDSEDFDSPEKIERESGMNVAFQPDLEGRDGGEKGRGQDKPGGRKSVLGGAGTRPKDDVPGQDDDDKSRDGTRKVPGTGTKEGRKSSGADDIPNGDKRKLSARPLSSTAGYKGKGEIGRPLSSIVEDSGTEEDEDLAGESLVAGDDRSRELGGAPNGGAKEQAKPGGRRNAPRGAGTKPNDDFSGGDDLESRDLGRRKGSRDEEPDKVDGQSKRKISDKPSPTAADRETKGKMGTRRSSPGDGSGTSDEDLGRESLKPGDDGSREYSGAGKRPFMTSKDVVGGKGPAGKDGRRGSPGDANKFVGSPGSSADEGSSPGTEDLGKGSVFPGALSGDGRRKSSIPGSSSAAYEAGGTRKDLLARGSQPQDRKGIDGRDGRDYGPESGGKWDGQTTSGTSSDEGSGTAAKVPGRRSYIPVPLSGDGRRTSGIPGPSSAAGLPGRGSKEEPTRGRQSQDGNRIEGRDGREPSQGDINTLKKSGSGQETDEPSAKDEQFASGRAAEARSKPRGSKEMESGAIRDSDIPAADGSRRRSGAGEKPFTAVRNKFDDVEGRKVPEGNSDKASQDGAGKPPKSTERRRSSYGDQPLLLEGLGLTGRERETDAQPSFKDERLAARTGPRDSSLADKGSSTDVDTLINDSVARSTAQDQPLLLEGLGLTGRGRETDEPSSSKDERFAARTGPRDSKAMPHRTEPGANRDSGIPADGSRRGSGAGEKPFTAGQNKSDDVEGGKAPQGSADQNSQDATGKPPKSTDRRKSSYGDLDTLIGDAVSRSSTAQDQPLLLEGLGLTGRGRGTDEQPNEREKPFTTAVRNKFADVEGGKLPEGNADKTSQDATGKPTKSTERRESSYGDVDKLIADAVARSPPPESKAMPFGTESRPMGKGQVQASQPDEDNKLVAAVGRESPEFKLLFKENPSSNSPESKVASDEALSPNEPLYIARLLRDADNRAAAKALERPPERDLPYSKSRKPPSMLMSEDQVGPNEISSPINSADILKMIQDAENAAAKSLKHPEKDDPFKYSRTLPENNQVGLNALLSPITSGEIFQLTQTAINNAIKSVKCPQTILDSDVSQIVSRAVSGGRRSVEDYRNGEGHFFNRTVFPAIKDPSVRRHSRPEYNSESVLTAHRVPSDAQKQVLKTLSNVHQQLGALREELKNYGSSTVQKTDSGGGVGGSAGGQTREHVVRTLSTVQQQLDILRHDLRNYGSQTGNNAGVGQDHR